MTDLPTGTVTFLFTDIEGSTRLLQELGEAYGPIQEDHMRLMREAIAEGGGTELRTEGDAFFAVFTSAPGALRAAASAQRSFAAHPWSHGRPIRVRMGMHTGEGRLGGDDYLGIDVNRAARIAAAGHGGQVLLSEATRALGGWRTGRRTTPPSRPPTARRWRSSVRWAIPSGSPRPPTTWPSSP